MRAKPSAIQEHFSFWVPVKNPNVIPSFSARVSQNSKPKCNLCNQGWLECQNLNPPRLSISNHLAGPILGVRFGLHVPRIPRWQNKLSLQNTLSNIIMNTFILDSPLGYPTRCKIKLGSSSQMDCRYLTCISSCTAWLYPGATQMVPLASYVAAWASSQQSGFICIQMPTRSGAPKSATTQAQKGEIGVIQGCHTIFNQLLTF